MDFDTKTYLIQIKKRYRNILAILFLLYVVYNLVTISQVLPFHTYTVKDGLSSNFVNVMCQDSRGYLWIGTTDGISIYDGATFKNITTSDGLSFSHVNDMIESKKNPGVMWIATNGGGVCKFVNYKMVHYFVGDNKWTNRVNCIREDHNGTIWCGADEGVFYLENNTFVRFKKEIIFTSVTSCEETPDSILWITNSFKLFYYDFKSIKLSNFDLGIDSSIEMSRLNLGEEGNLWIGLSDCSIICLGKK